MPKGFAVIIEKVGNRYIASVAGLDFCCARARILNDLIKNTEKAIKHHLAVEKDIINSAFIGVRILELRRPTKGKFTVVIEKSGKYYIAYVPSLQGCHTYAKTINRLMEYMKEVITLCLDTGAKPVKTDFVGVQLIEV